MVGVSRCMCCSKNHHVWAKRKKTDTHLSMWAALNTTSNSPPSRRAAFSAISAASSSRDSSNKNWPGGARENRSAVEMLRDPCGGTEGYTLCKCWTWLRLRTRTLLALKNKTLKHEIWVQHPSILWPVFRPISHISQPCYICLFSIKMLLVGGFMSYFESWLHWRFSCTDLTNGLGAVNRDWPLCNRLKCCWLLAPKLYQNAKPQCKPKHVFPSWLRMKLYPWMRAWGEASDRVWNCSRQTWGGFWNIKAN